jgi:dTDP-4-amino-4,6-dideoxygalactose transaminase
MDIRIDWPSRGHKFTEAEISAVADVMRNHSTALTQGPKVQNFEKKFADYIGADRAFALMSAAHGLDITAMLMEVGPEDEVIIPAHTYCASALAYARRGAQIKWADIDPKSFTASADSIRKLIGPKTKAIVIVHLYGLISPEIDEIVQLAKDSGIYLIEDCAQSLGAKWNGKHCGTFGDMGCYSFHSQKNLTTLGEGGMITVKNPALYDKVTGLRINGHAPFTNKPEYWLPAMVNVDEDIAGIWPFKSTMNEPQAAVGSLIIERMDELTEQRRERGLKIREALSDVKELEFQEIHNREAHSHHLLPARCTSSRWHRDDLIRLLYNNYGVKSIIQFYPLYRYDLFKKTGYENADVPETDSFFDNMISFPFSLVTSEEDFDYMIEAIRSAIQELNKQ